jgi:hypothetical protein
MKKQGTLLLLCTLVGFILLTQCTQKKPDQQLAFQETAPAAPVDFNGFESQTEWGKHLVITAGCNDCHTPKKMTNRGPVLDTSMWLAGHPAQMPRIDVDRAEMESKGLVVTMDLTEWVGPWGISFAANLTPDGTGIGNWTEDQFIYALRNGKAKGLPDARPILPPMPWEMIQHMTDGELKAIFAYLRSIKPINNLVPEPVPPTSAGG